MKSTAQQWRPIDTAPKNEIQFLAWVFRRPFGGFYRIFRWSDVKRMAESDLEEATHWLPLPEPPGTAI